MLSKSHGRQGGKPEHDSLPVLLCPVRLELGAQPRKEPSAAHPLTPFPSFPLSASITHPFINFCLLMWLLFRLKGLTSEVLGARHPQPQADQGRTHC